MEWGTEQEKYTHKCMLLFMHRYCYYVLNAPKITDTEYDEFERELKEYELSRPDLAHPNSPTKTLGSSDASNYPSSIVRYFGRNSRSHGSKIEKEPKARREATLKNTRKAKRVQYEQESLF